MLADQQKLREPQRFLIRRALGNRTDVVRSSSTKELRTIFGRRVVQIAAIHRLIESSVARNAFGLQRRREQIAAHSFAIGPVLQYVAVNRRPRDLLLRRQWT